MRNLIIHCLGLIVGFLLYPICSVHGKALVVKIIESVPNWCEIDPKGNGRAGEAIRAVAWLGKVVYPHCSYSTIIFGMIIFLEAPK
jgi:hypothetical protein